MLFNQLLRPFKKESIIHKLVLNLYLETGLLKISLDHKNLG